jgi:hypothetical protein
MRRVYHRRGAARGRYAGRARERPKVIFVTIFQPSDHAKLRHWAVKFVNFTFVFKESCYGNRNC